MDHFIIIMIIFDHLGTVSHVFLSSMCHSTRAVCYAHREANLNFGESRLRAYRGVLYMLSVVPMLVGVTVL